MSREVAASVRGRRARVVAHGLSTLALGAAVGSADAAALHYCDRPAPLTAEQQDTVLRFAGIVKAELEATGERLALVSRSGLDLSRFGMRYSHAGLSLKSSGNAPWSVRQLYYACDERRPKIYDQGMAGFLLGADSPHIGYLSAVLVPAAESVPLERAALDDRRALSLLGGRYSANAFAYSAQYQNCNQWVLELLATAWDARAAADPAAHTEGNAPVDAPVDVATPAADTSRRRAQDWLQAQGYEPAVFDLGAGPWIWLGALVPWLHSDDHPSEDLARHRYRVSMPASIEAFVHVTVPASRRLEFCHVGRRVVIRHGWAPIDDGCQPGEHDTVISLDATDGAALAAP